MIIIVILNVTRFSYFLVLRSNALPVWNMGNKSTKGSFLRARGVSAWLVISYFVRVRQPRSQGPFRTEVGQLIQWISHYLTSKIILWKSFVYTFYPTNHVWIKFFWKWEIVGQRFDSDLTSGFKAAFTWDPVWVSSRDELKFSSFDKRDERTICSILSSNCLSTCTRYCCSSSNYQRSVANCILIYYFSLFYSALPLLTEEE